MPGDMGMQRARSDQADEVALDHLAENRPAAGSPTRPARAATSTRRSSLKGIRSIVSGKACSAASPSSAAPLGMRRAISPLSRSSTSIEMCGCWQKGGQRLRQIFRQSRRVGEQADGRLHAAGKGGEIAAQRLHIVDDDTGMIEQAFAGRGQFDAAAAAPEEWTPSAASSPLIARSRRPAPDDAHGRRW